jgi:16S rRNA A1518/A1519 N6-dimethyltransferase RsmA/KsgA/DIM1 with predicted DNA glycosylase/AP lyase activity
MERLHALIGLAFRARRKKLAPQLASWLGGVDAAEARLAELGYPPTVRGEALTVEALRALARSTPKT